MNKIIITKMTGTATKKTEHMPCRDIFGFIFCCAMLLALVWLSMYFGYLAGEFSIQTDAIDAGVGEYYLDEDSHKQFRFITQEGNDND